MIQHRPILDVAKAVELYEKKDGVKISYVCTSAIADEEYAGDIFYRATPHPEFGNRYFRLFQHPLTGAVMIQNADMIEHADFEMVRGKDGWEYSRHRHDYYNVPGAGVAIDGGRAYCRLVGDISSAETTVFRIKDGQFKEVHNGHEG